jgi:HEPN domain-containing protein
MELDPLLVSNTREWLLRAKEDLDNAEHDLIAIPPFVRDALFHCQQVVEKAMKAFLTWHDRAFRKTHNLEELGELCIRIDGTLASAVEDVTPLTEYAARFRYPGAPWEPTLQEARDSINMARTFVQTILERLGPGMNNSDDRSEDSADSGE